MDFTQTNVMVDCETLAQSPNGVICSIGAVKFTVEGGISDEFYVTIDAKDSLKYGMIIEQQTLNWWNKQNPIAFKELMRNNKPLKDALTEFNKWFGKSKPTWACGASFDPPIIQWNYEAVGMKRPWGFWHDRCYRTMREIFPIPEPTREGTYHNALDDAKHQTAHLLSIVRS